MIRKSSFVVACLNAGVASAMLDYEHVNAYQNQLARKRLSDPYDLNN